MYVLEVVFLKEGNERKVHEDEGVKLWDYSLSFYGSIYTCMLRFVGQWRVFDAGLCGLGVREWESKRENVSDL
jgi:hypothetical protein